MGSEPKSHGALIGSIIVVAVLIVGGVYYFNAAKTQISKDEAVAQQSQAQADAQVRALSTQNTSDAVADIDADLKNTNIDAIQTQ